VMPPGGQIDGDHDATQVPRAPMPEAQ
jgi:hypothetical protein